MENEIDGLAAERHVDSLFDDLDDAIMQAMPELTAKLLMYSAEKAPSIDEEYQILMRGDDQQAEGIPPREGGRSADTDGRTRLIKPESTYLQIAMMDAENNAVVRGMNCYIGNVAYLNAVTYFEYENANQSTKEVVARHRVGPYFKFLDYGAAAGKVLVITPHTTTQDGIHRYPLRPNDGGKPATMQMIKAFPVFAMFDPTELRIQAQVFLTTVCAKLGPGRASNYF